VSLKQFALSTANLYAGAQPAGSLFGLEASDPVVPEVLHAADLAQFGTASDPMVGKHLGGVITFGGGLALYSDEDVVGGLGVSRNSGSYGSGGIKPRSRPPQKPEQLFTIGTIQSSTSGWRLGWSLWGRRRRCGTIVAV
jgi:hypothetical protein